LSNIVKEIKGQVENTLRDALKKLENVDSFVGMCEVLYKVKNMCEGMQGMDDDNIIDATLAAVRGHWSDLVDLVDDC